MKFLLVIQKNVRLPYNLGTDVYDFDSTKLSWVPRKSVVGPKLLGDIKYTTFVLAIKLQGSFKPSWCKKGANFWLMHFINPKFYSNNLLDFY